MDFYLGSIIPFPCCTTLLLQKLKTSNLAVFNLGYLMKCYCIHYTLVHMKFLNDDYSFKDIVIWYATERFHISCYVGL